MCVEYVSVLCVCWMCEYWCECVLGVHAQWQQVDWSVGSPIFGPLVLFHVTGDVYSFISQPNLCKCEP